LGRVTGQHDVTLGFAQREKKNQCSFGRFAIETGLRLECRTIEIGVAAQLEWNFKKSNEDQLEGMHLVMGIGVEGSNTTTFHTRRHRAGTWQMPADQGSAGPPYTQQCPGFGWCLSKTKAQAGREQGGGEGVPKAPIGHEIFRAPKRTTLEGFGKHIH